MNVRRLAVALAALLVAATLSACSSDPAPYAAGDCDRGDLREYDTDCGYWDQGGTFVLWYWVTSSGGYRPSGWHATYPYGASITKPHNAKLTKPKHQSTPPGVKLTKPETSSGGGSKTSRSGSSPRGGRR